MKRLHIAMQASACAVAALLSLTAPAVMANVQNNDVDAAPPASSLFFDELVVTRSPEGLAPNEVWVRIDLEGREMSVYRGLVEIEGFDYLAFGASGFQGLRLQGSWMTPTGEFRVDRINANSKFRRFYGINYPNKVVADKALEEGLITPSERRHIYDYINRNGMAPADTPLGGYIGIHGLGRSDPLVHQTFDWTQGCVAVSNDEIMALSRYLKIGTRVVIRG